MSDNIILRSSATTNSSQLAGSIFKAYEANIGRKIEITCVGAESINQAIKAVICAKKYFAPNGKKILIDPAFFTFPGNNEKESKGIQMILIITD